MTAAATAPTAPAAKFPPNAAFGPRLATGLAGIFIAAMMSGLNSRVGALSLPDIRGHLGFDMDGASWINTAYSAGELVAMPLAAWLAVTVSLRRLHLFLLGLCALIAAVLPSVRDLPLLIGLRGIEGLASGMMIPLLMMAALRFLPPSIRLHALALYALTATFAPNIAIWATGLWADQVSDVRWAYWQVIPLALLAAPLVAWGIPQDPPKYDRFKRANGFGMLFGVVGMILVAIGLDQGNRLDWFNSPLVVCTLGAGAAFVGFYLFTEWHHPEPFLKLQLLQRRNLGLGFSIFFCLIIVFLSGSLLPMTHLARVWEYRALQSAPIGLLIGLPQLVLAPAVAICLYQKWADARHFMALGLLLIALSCLLGSRLTSAWIWEQFIVIQMLQAVGQPLAVVSMLFLATSVVQPMEGPSVAGTVNVLRAFGALLGSAVVTRFMDLRGRFHAEMLIDQVGRTADSVYHPMATAELAASLRTQAGVLASADTYLLLGGLAVLLIPCAFALKYIAPPHISSSRH